MLEISLSKYDFTTGLQNKLKGWNFVLNCRFLQEAGPEDSWSTITFLFIYFFYH